MSGASAKASKLKEAPASARLRTDDSASGRLRQRTGKAVGKMADKAWQIADDKDDQATHLANTTVSMGAKGSNKVRHGVGRAAGVGRRAILRGQGRLDRKTGRQRAKGLLKKGGDGVKSLENGIGSMGGQMEGLAYDAESRMAAKAGTWVAKSPTMAARGTVKTVKGGVKATRATIRTTKAAARTVKAGARAVRTGMKATVKATQAAVQATARAATAAVHAVQGAVAAIGAAVGTLGLPVLAVIAAIVAVVALLTSIIGMFGAGSSDDERYFAQQVGSMIDDLARAGSVCEEVTPSLLAAQLEAESNFNPTAESPAGAKGIAQFMPSTWASVGMDGDGDGTADILNTHDAIWTQGNYMCSMAGQVKALKASGAISGETVHLTLAAYNAGLGNVTGAGGVPSFAETRNYIDHIMQLREQYLGLDDAEYDDGDGGGEIVAGTLSPALRTNGDGTVSTAGIDLSPGSSYAWGQCTWWAAIRRAQIGRPVDPFMGNGGDWAASGRRLGYKVSGTPHAGDALCFGRGVLGADVTYGHIAVVERVDADGGITISEANVRGVGVVSLRHISAAQLKAAGGGVQFIQ